MPFLTDLRFAYRAVTARPGFALLAMLTLGIGIGINAVVFSALNGLLFKSSRFPDAKTLGWIYLRAPGSPYGQSTWTEYQDLVRSSRAFEAVIAEARMPLAFHDGTTVRQIWGLLVSPNYLTTLRVHPTVGRVFTGADRADEVPAVVSHRFWTRELGGGSIAGKTLVVNARVVSVIGVLPDEFQGPGGLFSPDVWLPLDRIPILGMTDRLSARAPWLGLVGRLHAGVTPAQASADLQSVMAGWTAVDPGTNKNRTFAFNSMLDGNPEVRALAPIAMLALGIVSIVLLIACFNVAGLLLARAADRQRETSVRAALGAPRGRLVRQFVLEGVLLAAVSGVASVILANWSADLLAAFSLPSPIPQRLHIGIGGRVIAFTTVLVALAGLLPTLLPALQATRPDLLRSVRVESAPGQRGSRTRSWFVGAQIAGSTLFMTIALLMVQSFWTTARTSPGFETERLLVLEMSPSTFGYDAARSHAFFDNLLARVRALPGVEHAAVSDRIPFYVGFARTTKVSADGRDCATTDCRSAFVYAVAATHFRALGVPLVEGREFTEQDIQTGNGVIVNRTMAARYWPGRQATGEWIREGPTGRLVQVIGVAGDVIHHSFNEAPADYLYRPMRESDYVGSVTLIARTSSPAAGLAARVLEQVQALDPGMPPGVAKTMTQRMEMPLWPVRTAANFFLTCGTLAMVLAMVGLFGMTYLAVGQRTREFGIRSAIGATQSRIVRLVLGEGLRLTIPGVAVGLVAAGICARYASSVLFSVAPADVLTYALSALLQVAVTLAACLLPAIRATRADPVTALRAE
jgi:putative ABC transport system permease protein